LILISLHERGPHEEGHGNGAAHEEEAEETVVVVVAFTGLAAVTPAL
jgi:hypothetical protein